MLGWGDGRATAKAVPRALGLDDVIAEVLPDQNTGGAWAVGRGPRGGPWLACGVNDAPALARAQVGIAMSTGTDVAMECARVTLVKCDQRGIVWSRRLPRATLRNLRQNLVWAFKLGVAVAAGILYRIFGPLLRLSRLEL